MTARTVRPTRGGTSEHAARCLRHLERTFHFLLQHHRFEARSDDVFICSYPRSGTTWTQLIVHLLLQGGELSFRHIHDVVPWYERSFALRQATARQFAQRAAPRAFKTHLLPHWLPARGRYIYLRRDGLDVAVSYYALYRSHLALKEDFDTFFERFLAGRVQYRSWFDHITCWQARREDPRVLWLEYEHMRAEPGRTLRTIADFLGLQPSAARLREIEALTSLSHMRRHEALFDHATASAGTAAEAHATGSFVRQGQVGAGRQQVTAAQRRAFGRKLVSETRKPAGLTDLPAFLH